MSNEAYEFDVIVKVKKRVWLSGPNTKELAREILSKSLNGGMSINVFAKIGADCKPIEQIIGNEIVIENVE